MKNKSNTREEVVIRERKEELYKEILKRKRWSEGKKGRD